MRKRAILTIESNRVVTGSKVHGKIYSNLCDMEESDCSAELESHSGTTYNTKAMKIIVTTALSPRVSCFVTKVIFSFLAISFSRAAHLSSGRGQRDEMFGRSKKSSSSASSSSGSGSGSSGGSSKKKEEANLEEINRTYEQYAGRAGDDLLTMN